ncbi:MAG: hypothetical protein JO335_08760 [Sphingomonas sp.]|nr:hypothetical protein [Sphingomonas sp.]
MTGQRNEAQQSKALKRAVTLVTEAMDLLDAHGCSPDAAAHLAMAQQEMRRALDNGGN